MKREGSGLYCEWCGEELTCPCTPSGSTQDPQRPWNVGQFKPSNKPIAGIKKTSEHYYVLTMGEQEMGGTNKAALARYARKQGYKVVAE